MSQVVRRQLAVSWVLGGVGASGIVEHPDVVRSSRPSLAKKVRIIATPLGSLASACPPTASPIDDHGRAGNTVANGSPSARGQGDDQLRSERTDEHPSATTRRIDIVVLVELHHGFLTCLWIGAVRTLRRAQLGLECS